MRGHRFEGFLVADSARALIYCANQSYAIVVTFFHVLRSGIFYHERLASRNCFSFLGLLTFIAFIRNTKVSMDNNDLSLTKEGIQKKKIIMETQTHYGRTVVEKAVMPTDR